MPVQTSCPMTSKLQEYKGHIQLVLVEPRPYRARLCCRAVGLRRVVGAGDFEAPPGPSSDAVRLLLNIEIVAAKAFQRGELFVEYQLEYDNKVWDCGEWQAFGRFE